MRVVITGASGFVGSALQKALKEAGHTITPLSRRDYALSPDALAEKIDGAEVAINLAGATIAARWDEAYKKTLYHSRIDTTRALIEAFKRCKNAPKTLISASAVGRLDGSGLHDESSEAYADDFLGKLTADWETEALKARSLGVRVLIFRLGVVIGRGGMLQKMLPPFKLGLGGKLGSGEQMMSWIHHSDLIRAFVYAIDKPLEAGVYHLCAPHPVSNAGLTRALAKSLHRPAFMTVPAFAIKLLFGEGSQVMLSGQKVISTRLNDAGFVFDHPTIQEALDATLQKTKES